jgi:hypothetical protein
VVAALTRHDLEFSVPRSSVYDEFWLWCAVLESGERERPRDREFELEIANYGEKNSCGHAR